MPTSLLILNAGSSSLKFAAFQERDGQLDRILSGSVDEIGQAESELRITSVENPAGATQKISTKNLAGAAELILAELARLPGGADVAAVGHRVVHGGPDFIVPQLVTSELLDALRSLRTVDPDHLPAEIELIHELQRRLPSVPQIACFDTAFHHDLPRVAQLLPIPRRYADDGVRRFGFHGLSYEFLHGELARLGEPAAIKGRMILAHLGSGASLAALRDGRCVDTTMGFTPTGGLVMGTRSGDLDPGLMAYLARAEKMSAAQINHLVNHESGLRGISETTSDMRSLLEREATDIRAAEAVALFGYQAKKAVGALTAALGGLDALVFSGGIGENCAPVRARICDGLEFIGLQLDPARNADDAAIISSDTSRVVVRVIPTDEEVTIARHVRDVLFASTIPRTHDEPVPAAQRG